MFLHCMVACRFFTHGPYIPKYEKGNSAWDVAQPYVRQVTLGSGDFSFLRTCCCSSRRCIPWSTCHIDGNLGEVTCITWNTLSEKQNKVMDQSLYVPISFHVSSCFHIDSQGSIYHEHCFSILCVNPTGLDINSILLYVNHMGRST